MTDLPKKRKNDDRTNHGCSFAEHDIVVNRGRLFFSTVPCYSRRVTTQ